MITYEGIDRNFQFMILEIRRQLENTYRLVQEPSETLLRGILSRDNYIDTLKSLIEKKCISFYRHTKTIDKASANLATAVNVITVNLERMADHCASIATHIQRLSDPRFLMRFGYAAYFDELLSAVGLIWDALESRDTSLALRLCRAEATLNGLYQADYQEIRNGLRGGGDNTDNFLASLQILHYLERIGDAVLNIGEAVLFAATGEKLKLHEYLRLREALSACQPEASLGDYSIEFNWETNSGCRIAKVEDRKEGGSDLEAIFKKGQGDKLKRERQNIARWEAIMPGLPPRVLEFRDGEEDAGLLLEFLDGYTFRDLVLNGDAAAVEQALGALEDVLRKAWTSTRANEPINAHFVRQTSARIDEVFRLHSEFRNAWYKIGSLTIASLEDLLRAAAEKEESLPAPFGVFIHGDLNVDNIIFNQRTRKVHFIDLHRSKDSDYVQDVSVFLVSNFRLPVLHGPLRDGLNRVNSSFHEFVTGFARQNGDPSFPARLALGLARSLITSTRFEIDRDFAKVMYLRAVYLLERIIDHSGPSWDDFDLSPEVLIH